MTVSSGHHSQCNSLIQLKNCFTSFSSETFRANYKEFYITVTIHTLEENFPFTHILDTLISTCDYIHHHSEAQFTEC